MVLYSLQCTFAYFNNNNNSKHHNRYHLCSTYCVPRTHFIFTEALTVAFHLYHFLETYLCIMIQFTVLQQSFQYLILYVLCFQLCRSNVYFLRRQQYPAWVGEWDSYCQEQSQGGGTLLMCGFPLPRLPADPVGGAAEWARWACITGAERRMCQSRSLLPRICFRAVELILVLFSLVLLCGHLIIQLNSLVIGIKIVVTGPRLWSSCSLKAWEYWTFWSRGWRNHHGARMLILNLGGWLLRE